MSGDKGSDVALADASGYFTLPANTAKGRPVGLHIEKEGVGRADQSDPVGPCSVKLVLR